MSDTGTSADQLKSAIGAVNALVEEAQRELDRKLGRARRAAYEQLANAKQANDEEGLEQAICVARQTGVDESDVAEAEAKLEAIRARTPEERAAQAAKETEKLQKKEAYLQVKKGNVEALRAVLEGLDASVKWQDWRDTEGRDLLRYARDVRANDEVVRSLSAKKACCFQAFEEQAQEQPILDPEQEQAEEQLEQAQEQPILDSEQALSTAQQRVDESEMAKAEVELQEKAEEPSVEQASELPDPDPQQAEALRLKAFRMVVKDCVEELTEVLDAVPERMWTKWQNKANKDLLTLAEERGSSSTYAFLSKRLGIAKERENHAFMVSQAVWVFLPGEVVPNQATVWEDSPAEQSTVKVQMWDDDSETFREFDKCMVHRMNDS